jgi:hypothetical protein
VGKKDGELRARATSGKLLLKAEFQENETKLSVVVHASTWEAEAGQW